jgi:hypothetical protein
VTFALAALAQQKRRRVTNADELKIIFRCLAGVEEVVDWIDDKKWYENRQRWKSVTIGNLGTLILKFSFIIPMAINVI